MTETIIIYVRKPVLFSKLYGLSYKYNVACILSYDIINEIIFG
jgi:hypothetical protein